MSSSEVPPEATDVSLFAPLPRPPGQLRSLPPRFRWEVTRRHPIYLSFWTSAARFYEHAPLLQPEEYALRQAAVALLGSIGVSGRPIDPCVEFEAFPNHDAAENLLAGSVHPVSNRGLIGLLIGALPKETLAQLGCLFLQRFAADGNEDDQKCAALLQLARRSDPGLDAYVDTPILSISPVASQRVLERDLQQVLEQWRQSRDTPSQRERIDQYPQYLEVWDLREGWRDGAYDNSQELRLREVARHLQRPLSTVNNQYRRAFELITGHPYSPATWLRVFAMVKLLHHAVEVIGNIAQRRPYQSPTLRLVPDSQISDPHRGGTFVGGHARAPEDDRWQDLLADLSTFFAEGLSNEEILNQFQISLEHEPAIETFRQRLGENPMSDG